MYVTGSQKVAVEGPILISYNASDAFVMYGLQKGKRIAILGPKSHTDRYFLIEVDPSNYDEIELVTDKKADGDLRITPTKMGHHEFPDQTPIEVPAAVQRPESLAEMMQRMVREELSTAAAAQGDGTFEDEDDFDIEDEDDYDPTSPYEDRFLDMTEEEPVKESSEAAPLQDSERPTVETPPDSTAARGMPSGEDSSSEEQKTA